MAEFSSDIDTADESSPVRKVHKQIRVHKSAKARTKKLVPPELKVTPAQVIKLVDIFYNRYDVMVKGNK